MAMEFHHVAVQDCGRAAAQNALIQHCDARFMTPVINQRYIASCAAVAVAAAVGARHWPDYGGRVLDLSKMQLADCSRFEEEEGEEEDEETGDQYSFGRLYQYVQNTGLYEEDVYPYIGQFAGDCRHDEFIGHAKTGIWWWWRIKDDKFEEVLATLRQFPITASLPVYESFIRLKNVPTLFHHCNNNSMTPVIKQGYIVAVAAAVGARHVFDFEEDALDLSKQQLADCARSEDKYSFVRLFQYVQNRGLFEEIVYPYEGMFAGNCRHDQFVGNDRFGIYRWWKIEKKTREETLQDYPIVASMPVYHSFIHLQNVEVSNFEQFRMVFPSS